MSSDYGERLRERVKRCVHLAYGDADINAALEALITYTAAKARVDDHSFVTDSEGVRRVASCSCPNDAEADLKALEEA